MSATGPILPIELFKQIIEDPDLDTFDLYNLCLVSRALLYETSPVLYHTIVLRGARRTKLAIETFISCPRVAKLVQVLITRKDPDFFDFGEVTSELSVAISKLVNLKELRLFYLWTASPYHEASQGAARSGWTRSLNLSHIQKLELATSLTRPLSELFGTLPAPLPSLDINRPVQVAFVQGVRHLRCERLYGNPRDPLVDLKHLVVANIDSFPIGNEEWAPNFDSMAITGHPTYVQSCHWSRWDRLAPMIKTVKKVGPIACKDAEDLNVISFSFNITQSADKSFSHFWLPYRALKAWNLCCFYFLRRRIEISKSVIC
jgi:hypothetical protein